MKIISTFNDDLYEIFAKELIKSTLTHLPDAELIVYEELERNKLDPCIKTVKVRALPIVNQVYQANKDIIGVPAVQGRLTYGWNKRWFGWFMKVAMGFPEETFTRLDGLLPS